MAKPVLEYTFPPEVILESAVILPVFTILPVDDTTKTFLRSSSLLPQPRTSGAASTGVLNLPATI